MVRIRWIVRMYIVFYFILFGMSRIIDYYIFILPTRN